MPTVLEMREVRSKKINILLLIGLVEKKSFCS